MKKEFHLIIIISLFALALSHQTAFAGEEGDTAAQVSPTLSLNYWCNSNDSATLTARIFLQQGKGYDLPEKCSDLLFCHRWE